MSSHPTISIQRESLIVTVDYSTPTDSYNSIISCRYLAGPKRSMICPQSHHIYLELPQIFLLFLILIFAFGFSFSS
ncbi:hypothetical protein BJX70DRAFT_365163 [Aspergillus crustosus]